MSHPLDDIAPPTRAVKIKKRTPKHPDGNTSPLEQRPKVERNVMPAPIGEMPPPSKDAVDVASKNNKSQLRLLEAMKSVNRLMSVRVLAENRSTRDIDNEKLIIQELVQAVMEVEEFSPGEGILGMATLAIRQGLSLRDAGNRLAYELHRTREELKTLRRHVGELGAKDGEKKSQS